MKMKWRKKNLKKYKRPTLTSVKWLGTGLVEKLFNALQNGDFKDVVSLSFYKHSEAMPYHNYSWLLWKLKKYAVEYDKILDNLQPSRRHLDGMICRYVQDVSFKHIYIYIFLHFIYKLIYINAFIPPPVFPRRLKLWITSEKSSSQMWLHESYHLDNFVAERR